MQGDNSNNRDSTGRSANILRGLSSEDAGKAWVKFLDRYGSLIMNTASQFEYEQDRIDECFLYVCEKLNENGFRRLLRFNTEGTARFRTWLASVVFNLCVDWHRREFGRVRMLPAIAALPAFDRAVYHLVVERGMARESCYQRLRTEFPDLTRDAVANALGRIYSILTPRQRWQISVRRRGRSRTSGDPLKGQVERLPDPGPGPDAEAETREELDALQHAISHLPANQRLLLRLRFQEGLSLKKIARLLRLGNASRAWRHIQSAIRALSEHIDPGNPIEKRKN